MVDFQSHPDGYYKFILVYQDHLTKFVLKALKIERADEVAINWINISTFFGAPSILQFANYIVSSLKNYWPELKIIHGIVKIKVASNELIKT